MGLDDTDEALLPVPVLDDSGDWDGASVETVATTKAEYFDQISLLLRETGESFSLLEAFAALGVCPYGFIDAFAMQIVALESDASTYHILPSGGGIFDEPAWLLDAFRAVREANGDYYLWRQKRRNPKVSQ